MMACMEMVPQEMVSAGYMVLVGEHTIDNSGEAGNGARKTQSRRLDRVAVVYTISERSTLVANPLGGGLYILIPYGAALGVVTVQVSGGVVHAPLFRNGGASQTTSTEWSERRVAAAPWGTTGFNAGSDSSRLLSVSYRRGQRQTTAQHRSPHVSSRRACRLAPERRGARLRWETTAARWVASPATPRHSPGPSQTAH